MSPSGIISVARQDKLLLTKVALSWSQTSLSVIRRQLLRTRTYSNNPKMGLCDAERDWDADRLVMPHIHIVELFPMFILLFDYAKSQ